MPIVAIEAYRCAGQLAMNAHADRAATELWIRAIGVANAALPGEAAASSAPIVARSLAKVLLDLGSRASAQSLLEQADRIESGQNVQDGEDASRSSTAVPPEVRS